MLNRIVANFLLCLGSEEIPDGYESSILEFADTPAWITLHHWKWAFSTDDTKDIDMRIDELLERKNMLFKQIIGAEGAEQIQAEDDLSRCEIDLEVLSYERNLLRDVLFLKAENPELADSFQSIIKLKEENQK